MSIIDFHKNNEMNQDHEYNYDIPLDEKIEDAHYERPRDMFAPQPGQFSYKPSKKMGYPGSKTKNYMKFT